MTSIMPPPRFDETQRQIMDRVSGTVARAEQIIDANRSKDFVPLGADTVAKLKVSVEAGRDLYVRSEKTWEAGSVRNPIHIMNGGGGERPPANPSIAIWPPIWSPPESEYSKRVGDDMQKNAEAADAAFLRMIDVLEKAIEPRGEGVFLWNGELRALNKAMEAYQAALSIYENDKAQFVQHREVDHRSSPPPLFPAVG
jgi:hypothetical protein